jgi:hypothetical protein
MYYNLFLPGGIGGDGYKIFYISKSVGTKKIIAFQSIVLDRLFGVATIFILALILMAIIQPFENSVLIGILASFVVFIIGFIILKIFFDNFLHIMFRAFFLSVIIQLNQLVSAYCILRAVGVETHIMENLLLFLISSIVTIIPVTLGREITFLIGSEYLYIDLAPAIGLALIFFIITFITSLWGMFYSYTGIPLMRNTSS